MDPLESSCRDSKRSRKPEVVSDVMHGATPALATRDSLARAAALMEAAGARELPVACDGRLVGIVAERDLRPYRGHFEWTTVQVAMTHEPVAVPPDMSLVALAELLLARNFNAVPVVVEGRLVGMVRRRDLLGVIAPGRCG